MLQLIITCALNSPWSDSLCIQRQRALFWKKKAGGKNYVLITTIQTKVYLHALTAPNSSTKLAAVWGLLLVKPVLWQESGTVGNKQTGKKKKSSIYTYNHLSPGILNICTRKVEPWESCRMRTAVAVCIINFQSRWWGT